MTERRLTILDGLRGLAALSVVLYHYCFFGASHAIAVPPADWLPARPFLDTFYKYGFRAVELFWVISGFVFTYVYCLGRHADVREFAVNRFARLYPLHLVTLIVTALLQFAAVSIFGRYLIFTENDLYHFVLNLFMISAWGLQKGSSYNDVIWSVSVEIVVYALFWALRGWLLRWRVLGALTIAGASGVVVLFGPPTFIFACGFFFFCGSALVFASLDLHRRRHGDAQLIAALGVVGAANLVWDHPILSPSLGLVCSAGALVLLAVGAEAVAGDRFRQAAQWIGDCTYGIYLWHVPLQLTLMLILSRFWDVLTLARQGWFMIAYLAILLTIARTSFVLIERPARNRLRGLASRSPLARPVGAAT